MKTKIYNNLIFSLLFVCSVCGFLYAGTVFSQGGGDEQPPTTAIPAQQDIGGKEPLTLHLYSTIFGVGKEIKTSSKDRESVSRTIQGIFGRFFSIIFTLSGILMVTLLAVHGTRMIYAEFGGNVAVFSDAKGRVKSAAIGTVILLLSWVILNFIAPSLLRPRLFQSITGLQEVGQGVDLYSDRLSIPGKGYFDFDKKSGKLTLLRCPKIEDDFKEQVTSISASLRGDVRYGYQVLYSKYTDDEVYTYDEESGEKIIECKQPNEFTPSGIIKLPPEAEKIVILPSVFIVKEEGETTGTDQKKEVLKKSWRGLPRVESTISEREAGLRKYIESTFSYPADVSSSVETSETLEGYPSFRKITFHNFSVDDWDKETYGEHPLGNSGGKGGDAGLAKFTITRGNVFFKHATQNNVVKSKRITNWRPDREITLNIYFKKGKSSPFCIKPEVKGYRLKEMCYETSSE